MPQLLFLQNVGCWNDGVHPCIVEPQSSNITATTKQPGQQPLTEKDPPAWDQQRVRQTQPSGTVANLIPHLPWRWGAPGSVGSGTCDTPYLRPQLGCGRSVHIQGNAGLTSSCSQQGWGLARSATPRGFSKAMGDSHQSGRQGLGTILRKIQAWEFEVRHTNLGHDGTHPNRQTINAQRKPRRMASPQMLLSSVATPTTGCFLVGAHCLTLTSLIS